MIATRIFAVLFAITVFTVAYADDRPSADTGRDGAEDLFKEAVFNGLDKAFGDSGGTLVEYRGRTFKVGSGELLGAIDDVLIDPIVTAATTEGEPFDKFVAWLKAASVGGLKVYWPAYGLTVDAGKVVIGGSIYTTEQMIEAVREQQIEAIIFGRGFGGVLGSLNNPLAEQNFLTIPKVFRAGITAQNFGAKIESSAQLRDLWFGEYRRVLVKDLLMPAADVDAALAEGFGRLEEFWKLQRAGIAAEKFAIVLSREVLAAQYRAEQVRIAGEMAEAEAEKDDGPAGDEDADAGFGDDDISIVDGGDLDEAFGDDNADDDFDDEGGAVDDDDGLIDGGVLPDDLTLPTGDELADGGTTGELVDAGGETDPGTPLPLSGQIFDLVETKADAVYDTWVVAPGHVEVSGYGYNGAYDWSSPPQSIGAEGFMLNLSVTCQTEHGQRFATGIGARSGFKLEPTGEVPCNADVDDAQSGSVDIRVTPPQQVSPGSEYELRVGAFWGLGVSYRYRAR